MGSMMADLQGFKAAINSAERAAGKIESSLDSLMVQLFNEVQYVWPRLGYPPLVTPFSQYVKNTALMNLLCMAQGKPRFSNIDKDTWGMILGRMGKLPAEPASEIVEIAKSKGLEFFTGNPQDEYPDELPRWREEMAKEGWDCGPDDEELFELAMHERQYRDYRSGIAKERFNKDLEAKKAAAGAPIVVKREVVEMPAFDIDALVKDHPKALPLQAPAKGKMLWQIDAVDRSCAPVTGTALKAGECAGFVQTYYGMEEIVCPAKGRIITVTAKQGDDVVKGQIVALVE